MKERARRSGRGDAVAGRRQQLARRPWGSDPLLLGALVEEMLAARGWASPDGFAVQFRWAEVVGRDIARHLRPVGFDAESGTLRLEADSKAWATQIRLLVQPVLKRIGQEVGEGVVRKLEVVLGGSPAPEFSEAYDASPAIQVSGRAVAEEQLSPEHGYEVQRERLRGRITAAHARRAEMFRARELALRLPSGWLEGPQNLNPCLAGDPVVRRRAGRARSAVLQQAGSRRF